MDTYLGLDFGGTKLLIGELDESGNILQSKRYRTGFDNQKEAMEAILADLEDYKKNVGFAGKLRAAGMGIVGIVDCENGRWLSMNHEISDFPIPLEKLLEKSLDVPCAIDNDVRSATTAELILGKGQTSKNFIYLNVGTGLAAGFVTEGRIIRGANHNSGEVGHMVVDLQNDQSCVCGRHGCVESMVSGASFSRQVREKGLEELLGPDGRADVAGLFKKSDDGDAVCGKITDYAADTLACVIMNLVRVTDPDTVILGGGIISDGWLFDKVSARLDANTMRGVTNGVVFSSFDPNYAGLIGAASLGMLKIGKACQKVG